ncbi:MAG TPA: uracil-DNA glycosylase [Gammaproteobacteria bacterium]|jgi:uracil-DNA glycosylase|nr:uracil-DNA glycosylase [Gammaproteobacteria bacterium]MBT6481809.1 uracil-DNA glycosylase [Gammaproteobacteria bacterium]MBT7226970.1 uracil-DNA glycosylase [Gammaproteobacteria bacterium]HAS48871.1 uracil-DNA glycosylase [Gammaproteobacteria bacterium]
MPVAPDTKLENSWRERLRSDFESAYMAELRQFLGEQKALGKTIYPAGDEIFAALNATAFKAVKVVILGQDPYHGPGQAHGLSFSVRKGVRIPPSLQNIYKELATDVNFVRPDHGCLSEWAEQGVLLLNSVLTVEAGLAASHQGKGWEKFTDSVVSHLNVDATGIVFILWGNYAQKKGAMIDRDRHLVLQSVHPSPLSASRGFFGNHHFSKSNEYLLAQDKSAIDWELSA